MARDAEAADPHLRGVVGSQIALFQVALGRLGAAQKSLADHSRNSNVRENLALLAWIRGDRAGARAFLTPPPRSYTSAIILAAIGYPADAEAVLSDPEVAMGGMAPSIPTAWARAAAGHLAAAKGRTSDAIPLLEEAFGYLRPWPSAYFFLTADALAAAHASEGRLERALEILAAAAEEKRPSVLFGSAPLLWMRAELRRAELYRRLGRPEDARRVEHDLERLLRLADTDHPILRELAATARTAKLDSLGVSD